MSTQAKLLAALDGTRDVISGTQLAKVLGLTRTSIWKQVKSLQAAGIPIESAARNGYRFRGPADLSLSTLRVPAELMGWLQPHYEISTSSTQTLAKEGAAQGLPEGHLWLAEVQAKGRGRLDRIWNSGFGGLWFSVLLKPTLAPAFIPALPLVAALALAQTIRKLMGVEARLKWPNDVGIGKGRSWRKVAGMLTEMSAEMDRVHWVVLGLGLNVFNTLPAALRRQATTLFDASEQIPPRREILLAYIDTFLPLYRRFQQKGFEPFQKSYWELYRDPREAVQIQTAQGEVKGQVCGVDAQGRLIVESRRQTVHLSDGEILS